MNEVEDKIDRRGFLSYLLWGVPLSVLLSKWKKIIKVDYDNLIFLYEDKIAGFYFSEGWEYFSRLKVGDRLILSTEKDNPYDNNAVEIYHKKSGRKLGYISRDLNKIIFKLLNKGFEFKLKLSDKFEDNFYNYREISYKIWIIINN